jgi:DNA-binding transcriptional ArsR family regulator
MDTIEQLAETLKALADPTRLKLVHLLSQNSPQTSACGAETCNGRGFLCVNALAHRLGVTQSAVSQHLRVLRQAGLVRGERRGSFVHYALDDGALTAVQAALGDALGGKPTTT